MPAFIEERLEGEPEPRSCMARKSDTRLVSEPPLLANVASRTCLGVDGQVDVVLHVVALIKDGLDGIPIHRACPLDGNEGKTCKHDAVRHCKRKTTGL